MTSRVWCDVLCTSPACTRIIKYDHRTARLYICIAY